MIIAVLSDTHDNAFNAQRAVTLSVEHKAEALLFCGDFCAPGCGIAMAAFPGPIFVVFGNNDGDRVHLVQYTKAERSDVTFFDEGKGVLELGGRKIAMTHYPLYANALARTGDYDLVCFGHDHKPRIETYGPCLAVNPGTLNTSPFRPSTIPTFALYNTIRHAAVIYDLEDNIV